MSTSKTKNTLPLFSLLLLSFFANSVYANVIIHSTRIIYPENEKEIVVSLENKGTKPALVQSWIDDGNTNAKIKQMDVPFIILPPVSRIEPSQGQSLRISYTGKSLPADRESVFWFNNLDIPPASENKSGNEMQMAFRSRIKLFFRPNAIKGTTSNEAVEMLLVTYPDEKRKKINIQNNSPLYITISSVDILRGEKTVTSLEGKMIPPFSSESYVTKEIASGEGYTTVISYINDYGAKVKKKFN
ncbi:fimbria/pilus periplasmic chaperone [Pantoea sp. MBD-2R]|uniref:fimbria/pilus periplasmic chaperone n=1 Tax=unclassified Pantoea TaxID=2630326 RepID=UPI0011BFD847|nr:fimbria/pilus periplasmic chaperone [Pantoea sp. CCBC3-3-1]